MGQLSDQWRARAHELNDVLGPLLDKPTVAAEVIQAVKAAVLPELLLSLADMLQVLESTPEQNAALQRLQRIQQRNEEVRLAAIRSINEGKWDEFNRIVASVDGDAADA